MYKIINSTRILNKEYSSILKNKSSILDFLNVKQIRSNLKDKYILFLFVNILFIFNYNLTFSQWTEKNTGTNNNIISAHIRGSNEIAYAVGNNGVVIRTTNAGESWTPTSSPTSNRLNSTFFTSDNTGFVAGNNGNIFRTTNNGNNWISQTSRISNTINSLYFLDDFKGFYVANGGELRFTTNSGNTWSANNLSPTANDLKAIKFVNSNLGFAVGSNGTLIKTIDGGINWSNINTGFTHNITGFDFFDDTLGVLCTSDGRVLRTTNGGNNWVNDQRLTTDSLNSINFSLDKNKIYVAGNSGALYVSTNTGVNWTFQNSIISNHRFIYFSSLNTGYILGDGGKSLKTTNGGQQFPKSLLLLNPNNSISLKVGDTYEIKWESFNVENLVLQYSTNSGTNWTTIGVVNALNFQYNWVIPNVYTINGRLRAYDANSINIIDTAKGIITIDNKTLSLLAPNGGETILTNQNFNITWEAQNISNVILEYSTNNGTIWSTIVTSTNATTKSYSWSVPNLPTTVDGLIRISEVGLTTKFDISDNKFKFQAPELILNSPKNFDTIDAIGNYRISWSAINSPKVHILLSINNGVSYDTLAKNLVSPTSNFDYIFNNVNIAKAKIRIVNADYPTIMSENSEYFTIRAIPVILNYPVGNETFAVGTIQRILWSKVDINFVNIEYSINNGTNWLPIVKDFLSTNNFFDWTIPDNASNSVLMRIYNLDGNKIFYDTINNPFKIIKLKLLSPNNNSSIFASSILPINFDAKSTGNLKLEFTTDNGVNWVTIANNINPLLNQINWNVPSQPNQNVKLKISTITNPIFSDSVIVNIVVPSITLIKPNGGEFYQVGRKKNIEWNSSFVNKINIQFSTNSGLNWNNIVTNLDATNGKYEWNIPNIPNGTSLIRITDSERNNVFDVSNSVFNITTQRVDILTPNGKEQLYTNTTRQIRWSALNANRIDLMISRDNGITWSPIVNNLNVSPNSYNWILPNIPTSQALIKIRDSQKPDIEDITDNSFEIIGLALTTPKSTNEKWMVGSNQQIKWESHKVGSVNIQYSTGVNNWVDAVKNYPSGTGFYTWTIPNTPSTSAKIRIFDPQNTAFADTTIVPFTITGLVITNPIGGEEVLIGDSLQISWNSNNIDNIKIELLTDNGQNSIVLESFYSASLGQLNLVLPEIASNSARIRITSIEDSTISDLSKLFVIKGNGVVVKSPNGGEIYQISSSQVIRWTSANVASINIYYSSNGNKNTGWMSIANNLDPKLKQFNWTLPTIPSTEYRIKITDSQNEDLFDISDNNFTIKGVGFNTPSNWDFISYTGANSTLIIPASANVTVGARKVDTNDAIGVFYKRNNVDVCAGYIIWKSNTSSKALTIWGDNTITPLKDGFLGGESYVIKIWDAKEGKELLVGATYSSGTGIYNNDAISQVSSLISSKTLTIPLAANQWTLMSSNLIPANTDWKNITSAIQDTSFRIKDDGGKLYYPSQNINDLVNLEAKSAYLIYTSNPINLSIIGSDAQLNFYDFVFNTGRWYFMSYLPQVNQNIATVYTSINTRIILVKNPAGQVYYPSLGINDIVTMKPGEGYRIAVNSNLSFRYPTPTTSGVNTPISNFSTINNLDFPNEILNSKKTVHFKNNFRTTKNSAVWIITSKDFENSDEVAVYTNQGLIIGSGIVENSKAFITLWGASGEFGFDNDGAQNNEDLKLVLWKSEKNKEYKLSVDSKANIITGQLADKYLKYEQDAVWHIEVNKGDLYLSVDDQQIFINNNLINIYPNPINDVINIKQIYDEILVSSKTNVANEKFKLEIINLNGNIMLDLDINSNNLSNYIEVNNLINGVYYLKINLNNKVYIGKFIKL